jgi:hypothetical protein
MKRAHILIFSAWLIHAAAWFLPVITDGVRFPHGLPGWEAFRTALSPLWAYGTAFSGIGAVAAVLSAVTTIVFVLGSPWILWRGTFRRGDCLRGLRSDRSRLMRIGIFSMGGVNRDC